VPPSGATCFRVQKIGLLFGSVTVDVPAGIDSTRPWSMRLRLAPPADGGAPNGFPAFGSSGGLLQAQGWDAGVSSFSRDWPVGLAVDRWHVIEHAFDPAQGRFSVRLDGAPVPLLNPVFPPRGTDKHLGAITLGAGYFNSIDFWLNSVEFSQP
jgi:hypothetical protein